MPERTNDAGLESPRWLKAQEYEQAFWRRLGDEIETGTRGRLDWYQWRAGQLAERLASVPGSHPPKSRILEIGSGPVGIVSFMEGDGRVAIDPLEHFYRTRPSLIALRSPDVTYVDGAGEHLPFDDASFSLVIIDNVIDHTAAPWKILQQIARVLEPDGRLYLSVNVHTLWGALLHKALAAVQIDKGHPYTFTSASIRRLLTHHQFAILAEHPEDYGSAARADRRSIQVTDKIKGHIGLSEFSHCLICRK